MFEQLTRELDEKTQTWFETLSALPKEVVTGPRNRQRRNIQQLVGHMVDSAANNHHRIVRLQYTSELVFPDYRLENDQWIAIQNYQGRDWLELLQFWRLYHRHISHIIRNVDPHALRHIWHDCDGTEETLQSIIEGYLWHFNLHLSEIKALMDGSDED